MVDVGAGFLKAHALHVEEQGDALFESEVAGKLEQSLQFRLTAEDEGDSVLGIGAEVRHGLEAEQCRVFHFLSVVHEDHGLFGQLGNDAVEQSLRGA
ncbi:unnamed protein product [marine sediment metagenome]|uniref:Uncharacterized protein n=1 Tax=marine sediment metagenome TaxID=412755 RepID=X1U5X8_9ZZZZ